MYVTQGTDTAMWESSVMCGNWSAAAQLQAACDGSSHFCVTTLHT